MESAASEKVSNADAKQRRKVKRKKYLSWRIINIQKITLNVITKPVKLCMSLGTNGGVAKKGHSLIDGNSLLL